jgi:hypothetical protein
MKNTYVLLFCTVVLSCPILLNAQTQIDPAEISSTVPELNKFHEIIYPIWHDAYPAKDYSALKSFVPKIKSSVESINKAKLPGILRDKEVEWKTMLDELNTSAQNYYTAANNNDNEALLSAAERIHTAYERMNRVIRPAIKEIDDYHQVLYIIYHKFYPDDKFEEISKLTSDLTSKAEAILNYPKDRLKQRLGDNIAKYDSAAKQLLNATINLKEALNGSDTQKKKEAVESVHKAYLDLDSIFK